MTSLKVITLLFFLIFLPFSLSDFLCMLYGNNTGVLTGISTNGSISSLGSSTQITNPDSFTSQYYVSSSIFYVLYSYKYLFSFNIGTRSNQTILFQTGTVSTFCVSQQFGTVYGLIMESNVVNFVKDIEIGSVQKAASPFTLTSTATIYQCIIDDAYSRILWTYLSSTSFSIASTDILPQFDGNTSIINDITPPLQAWLLSDYKSETFYAITVQQKALHLSLLYLTLETVKWMDIGPIPVNATAPQGVLSPEGDTVAVMTPDGNLELLSVTNLSDSSTIKVAWGNMNSFAVNSMSLVWIEGSLKKF